LCERNPVVLTAYLKLDEMIASGSFSPVEQDIVKMVVSHYNNCDYCLTAHTGSLLSKGLENEEILEIRRGNSANPGRSALIDFTKKNY